MKDDANEGIVFLIGDTFRFGWAGLMLERGGHVWKPRSGLPSRALTKAGKIIQPKSNDTTEHHPARPALNNWLIL